MYYYSPSAQGFFMDEVHGGNIPADRVPLTEEYYFYLLDSSAYGFPIIADSENGARPMTSDECGYPPEMRALELPKIHNAAYRGGGDVPYTDGRSGETVAPDDRTGPIDEGKLPPIVGASSGAPTDPAESPAPVGETGAGAADAAPGGDDSIARPGTPTGPEIAPETAGSELVDEHAPVQDDTAPDLTALGAAAPAQGEPSAAETGATTGETRADGATSSDTAAPETSVSVESPAESAPQTGEAGAGGGDAAGRGDDTIEAVGSPVAPEIPPTEAVADGGEATAAPDAGGQPAERIEAAPETVAEWVAENAPALDAGPDAALGADAAAPAAGTSATPAASDVPGV